jgi:hypothetical protein
MKPSLISCCFSMSSLYRLRISINDDMSISLNVVRNAAVFCDSFNRSAMRSRILLIFTRFSFREGPLTAAEVVSAEGDVDCLLSSFGAGVDLLVSFTSALLLPCAGVGGVGDSCLGESDFGSTESPFSACGAASDDVAAEVEDSSASPCAKRKRSCPTVTVSSSFTSNSVILPDAGALTDTSICEGKRMARCQQRAIWFRCDEMNGKIRIRKTGDNERRQKTKKR